MGLDEVGFWNTSVRSAVSCVNASDGERLSNFFCTGKISLMLKTRYDTVLIMYNLRH